MTRLCLVVRLSRVMSHAHNVVRFPFFERVSRLDVRITDHGHVVGVRLVCLLVPGLAHSMLHTHRLRVARASPTRTKHPVRSDKHLFPWHRGHPSRTWDVPHLPWTCSCHLSSREAWVFSLTSMPITFTVRLLSSSLVFSRLLSSSLVFVGGFVCERLTSGVPVLVCHSHSRMLIRIRACVNRSTTHTCPPAPRLIACHDWHTRVVAQCSPPSLSPQLAHVFASMIPSRPTSPSPVRFVSHLRPEHVSHHPVFHVKHIRTPVRLPPLPLFTSRSPVLPHTPLPQLLYVDLGHFHRQPPTIPPHTSARPV